MEVGKGERKRASPAKSAVNADLFPAPALSFEVYGPGYEGKQRIISPNTHVATGVNAGSALPDDDTAGVHFLSRKQLDAHILRV